MPQASRHGTFCKVLTGQSSTSAPSDFRGQGTERPRPERLHIAVTSDLKSQSAIFSQDCCIERDCSSTVCSLDEKLRHFCKVQYPQLRLAAAGDSAPVRCQVWKLHLRD